MQLLTSTGLLALCLLVASPVYPNSVEPEDGAFQDVLDYVSEYDSATESDQMLFFYNTLLKIASSAGNRDHVTAVCNALVTDVPGTAVEHFSPVFRRCPEGLMDEWISDVHEYVAQNPVRLFGSPPSMNGLEGLLPAFVEFSYDVSPSGQVVNIQLIDSSHDELVGPTERALESWSFSPALSVEGRTIWAFGLNIRFVFNKGQQR